MRADPVDITLGFNKFNNPAALEVVRRDTDSVLSGVGCVVF